MKLFKSYLLIIKGLKIKIAANIGQKHSTDMPLMVEAQPAKTVNL